MIKITKKIKLNKNQAEIVNQEVLIEKVTEAKKINKTKIKDLFQHFIQERIK